MQDCTSLQTDNLASTPPNSFFTGRMPFLPPNQQRQSTEGKSTEGNQSTEGTGYITTTQKKQEAQLSPRDRAMRRVS